MNLIPNYNYDTLPYVIILTSHEIVLINVKNKIETIAIIKHVFLKIIFKCSQYFMH